MVFHPITSLCLLSIQRRREEDPCEDSIRDIFSSDSHHGAFFSVPGSRTQQHTVKINQWNSRYKLCFFATFHFERYFLVSGHSRFWLRKTDDRKVSSSFSSKKEEKSDGTVISATFDVSVSQLTFPKDKNLQKFHDIFFMGFFSQLRQLRQFPYLQDFS